MHPFRYLGCRILPDRHLPLLAFSAAAGPLHVMHAVGRAYIRVWQDFTCLQATYADTQARTICERR
eukprot:scaffold91029_cov14-Tisochrysis_lutea.AAC.1